MTFLDSQAVFTRIINLIIHLKSNSLKQIPYIGTEILYFNCFATKMLFSFCKSIIPEDFKSAGPHLSFPGVKTRFKTFLQNIPKKRPLRVDLMTPFTKYFQKKPPAGRLNDPFYWTCVGAYLGDFIHNLTRISDFLGPISDLAYEIWRFPLQQIVWA